MNDELGGLVKEMFFWRLPLTPSKLILLVCEINSNPWDSFKALSSLRFSFYNHFSVRMRLLLDGWNRTFPANVNYYSHCVCILWLLPFSLSVFVLFFFVLILYFFFFYDFHRSYQLMYTPAHSYLMTAGVFLARIANRFLNWRGLLKFAAWQGCRNRKTVARGEAISFDPRLEAANHLCRPSGRLFTRANVMRRRLAIYFTRFAVIETPIDFFKN